MNFKRFLTFCLLGIIGLTIITLSILVFSLIGKLLVEMDVIGFSNRQAFTTKAYAESQNQKETTPKIKIEEGKINAQSSFEVKEAVEEFKLIIPKIGVDKDVQENVNPIIEDEYLSVIETKVAHGKWTFLPNQLKVKDSGVVYLFAHREGESPFLNRLGEVVEGDKIYIRYNGRTYTFKMVNRYIVDPNQTDFYTAISPTPILRIQTCENGESQRLIIDAELIEVI